MKKLLFVLVVFSLNAFGQTKQEIKDDLEWVALTLQNYSKNYAFDDIRGKFYKTCKTDYDENKLTITTHFYNPDGSKINSFLIQFSKLSSTNALFNSDNNDITIYFGDMLDMKNKSEIVVYDENSRSILTGYMFTISNEGEPFVWKKMKEKLEKIRNYANKSVKAK